MKSLAALLLSLAIPASLAFASPPVPQFTGSNARPYFVTASIPSGSATLPSGAVVRFAETKLPVNPPERRSDALTAQVPATNYADWFEPWTPWPHQGSGNDPICTIDLSPHKDEAGTLILGGLFWQFIPQSVTVASSNGAKTFLKNVDYKYNPEWGQIASLGGRLGELGKAEVRVSYEYILQRLDLAQVDAAGKVTLKPGQSVLVCPDLPDPDPGCAPVAGVYLTPWRYVPLLHSPVDTGSSATGPTAPPVFQADVYPIHPAPPVAPVNPDAVAALKKKLAAGEAVKIAFLGDSLSVGAEAGEWWTDLWTDKNLGFPSRLIVALRKQFPKAAITPLTGFQGSTTTKYGLITLNTSVLPANPDLVFIEFALNDAGGPLGGKPNVSVENYKTNLTAMVRQARAAGAAVILIFPYPPNPLAQKGQIARRVPDYRQAMLDVANAEKAGFADVYTEWQNQATRGLPPESQLHNCINHPGPRGHKLIADLLLRFFE